MLSSHARKWRILVRTRPVWLLAAACLATGPVQGQQVRVERARYLMGTICRGTVYHADENRAAGALGRAFDAIADLEALLSAWRPDSELSLLNSGASQGPVAVSESLLAYLDLAVRLAAETEGAFDPTIGALSDAWGLRGTGRVPTTQELALARHATGYRHLRLDTGERTVTFLRSGLRVETGAMGKGFALDRASEVLRAEGVRSALLDFGGQLLAIGAPPGKDAWEVAITDPARRDKPAYGLLLRDASLATSGQSERRFETGGRGYGHVLDPGSGMPVPGSRSVTVLAPTGSEADAYSTALLVMGQGNGAKWLEKMPRVRAIWLGNERWEDAGTSSGS
jgi:thiamine biosynthesis lipoprotein